MIMDERLSSLIDICLGSKGAHYDVAHVVHYALKDRFRYVGDNCWEIYSPNQYWIEDVNRTEIEMAIKLDIRQLFTERALYWQDKSLIDDAAKFDCQLRCYKLLEICIKLGKDRFVKDIIKEARSFFVVENNQ